MAAGTREAATAEGAADTAPPAGVTAGANRNHTSHVNHNKHHPEERDVLFSKDTFVISPEDLQMINDDVQKQVNIADFEDWDYEEDYEEEEEGEEEDEEEGWNDDRLAYKETDYLSDAEYSQHSSDRANTRILEEDITFDSDAEYDNTHFLYDPPIKYKNKFMLYVLKSSPLLIILIAIFMISGNMSGNGWGVQLRNPTFTSSFLNHKLFILEEEVENLKKLKGLEFKVNQIQINLDSLKRQMDNIAHIGVDNYDPHFTTDLLTEKMSEIEKTVESLSKLVGKELCGKVETPATPEKPAHNDQQSMHISHVAQKYYNVANQCRILRQLTSYPALFPKMYKPKRRNSLFSKIVNGFPDAFARLYHYGTLLPKHGKLNNLTTTNDVKLLGNIEPLSSSNSPRNALLESPNMFWQNHMAEQPVYFTFQLPILENHLKLHEIGLYHSKMTPKLPNLNMTEFQNMRKRWFKCAPQKMELLVRLSPSVSDSTFDNVKGKLSKYYNQELTNFQINNKKMDDDQLQKWLRVGEMDYDINENVAYQHFIWPSEVEECLANAAVQDAMIIIHSNWGDPLLVLETVRVYVTERETDGGDDDDYEDDDLEHVVTYLGQE